MDRIHVGDSDEFARYVTYLLVAQPPLLRPFVRYLVEREVKQAKEGLAKSYYHTTGGSSVPFRSNSKSARIFTVYAKVLERQSNDLFIKRFWVCHICGRLWLFL